MTVCWPRLTSFATNRLQCMPCQTCDIDCSVVMYQMAVLSIHPYLYVSPTWQFEIRADQKYCFHFRMVSDPKNNLAPLLFGISGGLIKRLQSVQNAAARLVTGASRRDHNTPVMRQLYWLPVKQRIDIKLVVLVYKSLHGLALPYLSDDCQLVTDVGRRHVRSSDVYTRVVPWT